MSSLIPAPILVIQESRRRGVRNVTEAAAEETAEDSLAEGFSVLALPSTGVGWIIL